MNLFSVKNLIRLPLILAVGLTISSSNLFGTSKAQAYHPCPPLHRAEHTGLLGEIPVCVPSPPPINPPTNPTQFSEEAWGQAGAVGYQAASDTMRLKNVKNGSQDLDATQKRYLRPHFGNLVDRVQVIYKAQLMDTWSALGKEVHLGEVESDAQTYCDRIYVRESYKPNDSSQTVLLAHELIHSKQCENLGGMTQFGYHYFKEYKRGGQNYANNAMEKEAKAFEGQFEGWLSQEIVNPSAANQDLQQQGADLYRTILGRDPEPGAAEGLASRLANGSTLAREREIMANSEESKNNAVNLYRTILGREPEAGAAEGIVSRLAKNSTLAREREIMANSEESRNNLANLYRTILGREPEAGAVDGLVSRLANGSTLAQEREIMANSEEARRRR
jgi:hypothetical protein